MADQKSHFFKANPLHMNRDGTRACAWCGKNFYPSKKSKNNSEIYCSDECKKEAHKFNKHLWYLRNRERVIEKQKKLNKKYQKTSIEVKPPENLSPPAQSKIDQISFYKTIIIKRELIRMEMQTFQMEHNRFDLNYSSRRTNPKYRPRIDFIIQELEKKNLYTPPKQYLDFKAEYKPGIDLLNQY